MPSPSRRSSTRSSDRPRRAPAGAAIRVPDALERLAREEPWWEGWVRSVGATAGALLERWSLRVDGEPFDARHALVIPVRDADDEARVLKVALPDEDGAGEIAALKAWDGRGAARLLRADPRARGMLLERLGPASLASRASSVEQSDERRGEPPGAPEGGIGALEACAAVAGLYPALHVPAPPPLPPLAPLLSRWLDDLESLGSAVPAPPRLVERALRLGRRLAGELADLPGGLRVVHGDLHGGNVLAGVREPWQAIDPQGFAGDPCYEPAPLLWNRWEEATAYGRAADAVRSRFWAVIDAAGLDEERCRDWVIVRAVVAASWEAGGGEKAAARERVTRYVTVAKAMEEVGGAGW